MSSQVTYTYCSAAEHVLLDFTVELPKSHQYSFTADGSSNEDHKK